VGVDHIKDNADLRIHAANAVHESGSHAGSADNGSVNILVPEQPAVVGGISRFDTFLPQGAFIVEALRPIKGHENHTTPLIEHPKDQEHSQTAGIPVRTGDAFIEHNYHRLSLSIISRLTEF
jgi:hypothetical protein